MGISPCGFKSRLEYKKEVIEKWLPFLVYLNMKTYKTYIYGLLTASTLFLVVYLILHSLYDGDFVFSKSLIKGIKCVVIGMWLPVFLGILISLFVKRVKKSKINNIV